jgi:hypothetical protein
LTSSRSLSKPFPPGPFALLLTTEPFLSGGYTKTRLILVFSNQKLSNNQQSKESLNLGICFVPAGLVVLIHGRESGPFLWWDRSNVVLTTRRSPKMEKAELVLMAVLWSIIFVFAVAVIFFLSR